MSVKKTCAADGFLRAVHETEDAAWATLARAGTTNQVPVFCAPCGVWHIRNDPNYVPKAKSPAPGAPPTPMERAMVLERVLLEVWRKTTAMLGRPTDQIDVAELRAILQRADPDWDLTEAIDRLVVSAD